MNSEGRARGRPRDPRVDRAVLTAAIELLAEGGLEAATIAAIAQRSGVARATIYLRWPGRDALIAAALRRAIGRDPYQLTGNIEADIAGGGDQLRAILAQPAFVAIFPALVRGLLRSEPSAAGLDWDTLFPGRVWFADEYRLLAEEQGFRTDISGELVIDLLIGSGLTHLLATGRAPTAEATKQVVDLIVAALRRDPE